MTSLETLPTREAVLAHGVPEGFIELHRQQARIAQARAMGEILAALWRRLNGATSREASLERRLA